MIGTKKKDEKRSESMSILIIFALGYAIGGVSALLIVGLTLAGRTRGDEHPMIDLVAARDVEHYSL
jgi:hypothetical protein